MKYKVNLFPLPEKSLIDHIIYFSFHYLRYILVLTQLIVIIVFFYRFKVDQEIVDLKDALNQKEEIVMISEPLIREVQGVEYKITNAKKLVTKQQQLRDSYSYVISIFPEKLNLISMDIDKNANYRLQGFTTDPEIVRIFYNRLKKDKKFAIVELQSLNKDLFDFKFTFNLKNWNHSK